VQVYQRQFLLPLPHPKANRQKAPETTQDNFAIKRAGQYGMRYPLKIFSVQKNFSKRMRTVCVQLPNPPPPPLPKLFWWFLASSFWGPFCCQLSGKECMACDVEFQRSRTLWYCWKTLDLLCQNIAGKCPCLGTKEAEDVRILPTREGLPGGVLVPLFPSKIALCSHVPEINKCSLFLISECFRTVIFSNFVPLFPKIG